MKKIIAALDGLKYSGSTTRYAVQLAKQSHAHLVGVFLDDFTYHSYKIYELIGNEGVSEEIRDKLEAKDIDSRHAATEDFVRACQEASVEYTLHHDRSIAKRELLHESIYADLLVIDRKETFTHYKETLPTRFVSELLSEMQCPVLLVPEKYKPIEKLVLLFDGEPTSVYAIRMFSYVFAALKYLPVEVITVKGPYEDQHLPDNKLMKEFMKRHFPEATYKVLQGMPETEIINNLRNYNSNALVVLGAYNRGMISRWFRSSMADVLMKAVNLPLFIAHTK